MVECSKKKELRHFSFVRKCLFDNFRPHISGLNSITSFSVYFEEDFFHLVVDENPWSNLAKEDDHQEGKELGEKSEKKANTKKLKKKKEKAKKRNKKRSTANRPCQASRGTLSKLRSSQGSPWWSPLQIGINTKNIQWTDSAHIQFWWSVPCPWRAQEGMS